VILVAGHLTIKPESRDEALALFATTSESTRQEPGCLDYRFGTDVNDPDRIMILEKWEDEEAMSTHMATPALAEFMGTVFNFLGGPAEVIRHDVSAAKSLF
jgi:quinol monooxygenase YgiN